LHWTFQDVIHGLYNWFAGKSNQLKLGESMMKLKYKKDLGAQKLYNDLLDVAKNMLVYPGEGILHQKFPNEILAAAIKHILDYLVPEIHLLENLMVEVKQWEEIERWQSIQTKLQPKCHCTLNFMAQH
jgi:hypothetical protein